MSDDKSRRTFLKVAGSAAVVGGIGVPVVASLASGSAEPAGKQWGMVIDIKKCLSQPDCTKCKQACHQTHNVPDVRDPRYGYKTEEEFKRREVKWIWKENYDNVFHDQNHEHTAKYVADKEIPILCNHCANPPCVRVCPTQATFKRESDGIVVMDMHRCIGCRYCVVGCPYGARSFNWSEPWPRPYAENGTPPSLDYPTRTKGVVEKCNFCSERLVAAEREGKPFVPACVEVCPANALVFGDVSDENSAIHKLLETTYTIRRKTHLGTKPQIYYVV
jgi:[DsrC]-trisulfide reductase subunit O